MVHGNIEICLVAFNVGLYAEELRRPAWASKALVRAMIKEVLGVLYRGVPSTNSADNSP